MPDVAELARVNGPVEESVLVVTRSPWSAARLPATLEQAGRSVAVADDAAVAIRRLTEDLPDLVLLDEPEDEPPGFDLLAAIRQCSPVPVIVLSANDDEEAKVSALDQGADEYVTKPCGERELRSRVQAVLRRSRMPSPTPKTCFEVDDYLQIDFSRREVIVDGRRVALRPTEYRLLYHLVNNAGRVLTHETLLAKVWGYEYRTEEHYVRLYVTYLRQKIEPDPRRPRYILNERGLGYRFRDLARSRPDVGLLAAAASGQ
ncbi:MAG TPA: response regulator transcription factor [Chloroflexota bacterium]|nr:response regulator transcription factor [Chloroflexota bacterium]